MNPPSTRQLILPSLCADALAIGTHWIYNPSVIARLYPEGTSNYDNPRSEYHPGKSAGDFTHYGDQTLALLKSVVLRGGFEPAGWREDWQRFWKADPPAYRDGATKATLGFLEPPTASPGSRRVGSENCGHTGRSTRFSRFWSLDGRHGKPRPSRNHLPSRRRPADPPQSHQRGCGYRKRGDNPDRRPPP